MESSRARVDNYNEEYNGNALWFAFSGFWKKKYGHACESPLDPDLILVFLLLIFYFTPWLHFTLCLQSVGTGKTVFG